MIGLAHSLSIGAGVGGGVQWSAPGTTLALALLPSGIEHSGGVVTRWRDDSGLGRHGTPTSSPAVALDGIVPGVVFGDSGDRIDGAISYVDQPCTVFIACKPGTHNLGDYAYLFDASDNGSTGRSTEVIELYGLSGIRQPQGDANAAVADTATLATVRRGDFAVTSRSYWADGYWKASHAHSGRPSRSPTSYRLGQRQGGGQRWDGTIYAVLVYAGAMNEHDRRRIQAQLLTMLDLPPIFAYPTTAATNAAAAPRYLVPPVLDALVGVPLEIWKGSVDIRDGADASRYATSDLPFNRSAVDRWSVTPPAADLYDLSIISGSGSVATIINAVEMPTTGKAYVLPIGDSNMNRAGAGLLPIMAYQFGADRLEFVGTKGPNAPFTVKHEGIDSWTWTLFNGATSPFFSAGVLNMGAYAALLDHDPTHIWIALGQNDVYNSTIPNLDTTIAASFVHAETLIAAFRAQWPGVKIGIALNYPLNADPAIGWGTASARYGFWQRVHRYAEAAIVQFDGRAADGISLIPTIFRVDPVDAYLDPIHMNPSPGHEQLARVYGAWLAAHWS